MKELAKDDWRVKFLRTIPGPGDFFNVLVACRVNDTKRFMSEKKFFSYIGIIPSTFSSGGKIFHCSLARQGNKYLRWAMIETIWLAIQVDSDLKSYYRRKLAEKGLI